MQELPGQQFSMQQSISDVFQELLVATPTKMCGSSRPAYEAISAWASLAQHAVTVVAFIVFFHEVESVGHTRQMSFATQQWGISNIWTIGPWLGCVMLRVLKIDLITE